MSDNALWTILLFGAAVRLYGPPALLVVIALLIRKRWEPEAPGTDKPSRPERSVYLRFGAIVLFLSVAAASAIFVFVSLKRGPLGWDESTYVYKAYGVSKGIRHFSPGEVWQAVATGDRLYPPVSSFIIGAAFAVFGSSQTVALLCTSFGFVLAAALLFEIGCLLDARRGHLVGLISVLLFLGTPLLIEYGGTVMLEVAGIVGTLLAIIAYLRHMRQSTELTALATGLALALLFFTKYNYGLFAIGAVALCQLTRGQWQPWRRENLWLWVPVAVLADLWFTVEGKWEGFIAFATNHDMGMPMLSSASLLFYPRYFLSEYTSSIVLGVLTILAGVGAVVWIKKIEVRCVLVFFAVALGAFTVHHLKEERYLATVVPMLYLLAAFTAVQDFDTIKVPWIRRSLAAAGSLLLIPSILLYFQGVPRLVSRQKPSWSSYPWSFDGLYRITDFMLSKIDPSEPTCVTGLINEWSPEYVHWRLDMAHPGAKFYMDTLEKGKFNFVSLELLPGSPYLTEEYYLYHSELNKTRLRLESHVKPGIRTETILPREGLKLVIVTEGELTR